MLLDSAMMSPDRHRLDRVHVRVVDRERPHLHRDGTWKRWSSPTEPVSRAAAAVMILLTDPGSKESVTARLRIASCEARREKSFGSNQG